MVDEGLRPREKLQRVRKNGVAFEGFLIDPARVHMEEARLARGSENVDGKTARFRAHWPEHLAHRGGKRLLPARTGVKPGEDEGFHEILSDAVLDLRLACFDKLSMRGFLLPWVSCANWNILPL
jgi:hypothetical protein